jgi:hypothetical protein
MSGRITDLAVYESNPRSLRRHRARQRVEATNAGTTFEAQFRIRG